MAQLNLEIVSRLQRISLSRRRRRQRLRRAVIRRDLRRGHRRQFLRIQQIQRLDIRRPRCRQTVRLLERLHRVLRARQERAGAFARIVAKIRQLPLHPVHILAGAVHFQRPEGLRRHRPGAIIRLGGRLRRDVGQHVLRVQRGQLQRGAEFRVSGHIGANRDDRPCPAVVVNPLRIRNGQANAPVRRALAEVLVGLDR